MVAAVRRVDLSPAIRVLDLGCGLGAGGAEFLKIGSDVTFTDIHNVLYPELQSQKFVKFDLDKDDYDSLGQYDLVLFINVFEHIANPKRFINECHKLLKSNGKLYFAWTNWLGPYGGHEYCFFHYLGAELGFRIKRKLTRHYNGNIPYVTLFPTYIGKTIRMIRATHRLEIERIAPRYYSEFSFLAKIPIVREFVVWNCVMLLSKKPKGR